MKKVFYCTLILLAITSISSCKSCKKDKVVASEGTVYNNLIVSFYSPGNGIDSETANKFVAFLDSYTPKITYTIIHWGREGETDYCIDLNELSPEDQNTFKEKAKEMVSKSERVNVSENEKCKEVKAED